MLCGMLSSFQQGQFSLLYDVSDWFEYSQSPENKTRLHRVQIRMLWVSFEGIYFREASATDQILSDNGLASELLSL
jgi:hypothetical protein